MTLEERLNELETAIQAIRRDMQKPALKFKVGDRVLVAGVVERVDETCTDGIPYKVLTDTDSGLAFWFPESSLSPVP